MHPTLAGLFAAADLHQCTIIHISKLAGCDPIVPNRPCPGDATGSLMDLSAAQYLALMAEFHRCFVVESECVLADGMHAGGGDPGALAERAQLPGRMIVGVLAVGGEPAAATYLLDGAGQETTVIYRRLRSPAQVRAFWERRMMLCLELLESYDADPSDVRALCNVLDRDPDPLGFALPSFAKARGLRSSASVAVPS